MRRFAVTHGVLDVPNERSSHSAAIPRGGGAAIALVLTVAVIVLALIGTLNTKLSLALLGGGAAVAVVGFIDDRRAVPAGIRLGVHLGAAIWAVVCLGGWPALRIGDQIIELGWAGHALAVLGIVWTLNLFNFMDGIDGIAASEAVFIVLAAAFLSLTGSGTTAVPSVGLVLAATCAGFLVWNWPPAKIFMGDVGSGYLGYVIAVLALAAARDDPVALWVWLILGGAFFVDATVTLVRRAARGDRVHEAHRSHAYQWLARRWGSHHRVTIAFMTVNVLWLLPCAALAMFHPHHAAAIVIVALAPLVALTVVAGAGRRESAN
jgi:Fuc2NAc and GlcNAc transferase